MEQFKHLKPKSIIYYSTVLPVLPYPQYQHCFDFSLDRNQDRTAAK